MFNDWFTVGPFTVHGYGVMMAVGILAAIFMAEKNAKRFNLEYDKIENFIFFSIIMGFLVSKLCYIITVFDQFMKNPLSVLGGGGWVIYGAIIGGILGAYIYCKRHNWDFMKVLNIVIVSVPLAQGFGRIGCFFAGCCYGIHTDAWFGITFPEGSLCPIHEPLVPTQLIMSLGDFVIFAILYYRLVKKGKVENTAALYLILYSVGRFLVEFIRGDFERGHVGVLSTSQFIGVFVIMFAVGLFLYQKKRDNA